MSQPWLSQTRRSCFAACFLSLWLGGCTVRNILFFIAAVLFSCAALAEHPITDSEAEMYAERDIEAPFCHDFRAGVMNIFGVHIKNAGYADDNLMTEKDFDIKVLGFKRLGYRPKSYQETLLNPPPRKPDVMFQLILHISFKGNMGENKGKPFSFIVITDVSEGECPMSEALMIELSPKLGILDRWEDYLQGMERMKQGIPNVTPNLVK
jgi:hypothetical protein